MPLRPLSFYFAAAMMRFSMPIMPLCHFRLFSRHGFHCFQRLFAACYMPMAFSAALLFRHADVEMPLFFRFRYAANGAYARRCGMRCHAPSSMSRQ